MGTSDDLFWKHFHEIYEALPRQGPGDRESTERALGMIPPLEARHRILDIGCGSGAQTLDLARATPARIVAIDSHAQFISQLKARAAARGLADRIEPRVGDMNDLGFPDGSFDAIWCEGAIFIIGFAKGLSAWRRLLVPGGHAVVSEFCWFTDNPPAEYKELFIDENTDAASVEARRKAVAGSGYRLLGDFVLPDKGWRDNYYAPLAEVLERFREKHAGDPEALKVAARSQREIDLYGKYPGVFGYVFFVMRRDG